MSDEATKYELLDQRDEDQILAEIKGAIIDEMFYSFKVDGREVTGVSWVGTKEIARQYGAINLDYVKVEETDDVYTAIVKATDTRSGTSLLGTAMQPKTIKVRGEDKPDRFAYTKAVSKAQRNAIRAIIPERFLIECYEAFKAGKSGDTAPEPKQSRKKVPTRARVVPKDQMPVTEDLVTGTLVAHGQDLDGLVIYNYNGTIRVEFEDEPTQERFNILNPVLFGILKAQWIHDAKRWELPQTLPKNPTQGAKTNDDDHD